MAQFSTGLRDAIISQIETTIGASPILEIRSGTPPGVGNVATGTLLASMTLPSDWLAAPSSGVASMLGTWEDTSADATGTAGYFRILESTGTTAYIEGTITATGGGGDLELVSVSITSGQPVSITAFTLTAGNA